MTHILSSCVRCLLIQFELSTVQLSVLFSLTDLNPSVAYLMPIWVNIAVPLYLLGKV